jgi:hypothetical protein
LESFRAQSGVMLLCRGYFTLSSFLLLAYAVPSPSTYPNVCA